MIRRLLQGSIAVFLLIATNGCEHGNGAEAQSRRDPILAAVQKWEQGRSRQALRGESLYQRHCEICHADNADGNGFNAYLLDPRPADLRPFSNEKNRKHVLEVISKGTASIGNSALCPPWGRVLSPEESEAIFSHLLHLNAERPPKTD